MDGLEKRITNLIEKLYNCVFIGELKVTISGDLYKLEIFINDPNFGGFTLAKQCDSEDEFIEFLTKELKRSQLASQKFQQLIIQPYEYISECESLQEGF